MRRMARSMIVVRSPASDPAAGDIEIVERKGLGHPDTICDALAEQVSLALSRHYFDRFNRVLHHNVDKILLVGGAARPLLEAAKSSSRSKFAWLVAQRRSTAMSRSRLTISRWVGVDDGCDITSRTWTWIVGADYVAHQAGFAGPGCPLRARHGNPTCQRHVNRVRLRPVHRARMRRPRRRTDAERAGCAQQLSCARPGHQGHGDPSWIGDLADHRVRLRRSVHSQPPPTAFS